MAKRYLGCHHHWRRFIITSLGGRSVTTGVLVPTCNNNKCVYGVCSLTSVWATSTVREKKKDSLNSSGFGSMVQHLSAACRASRSAAFRDLPALRLLWQTDMKTINLIEGEMWRTDAYNQPSTSNKEHYKRRTLSSWLLEAMRIWIQRRKSKSCAVQCSAVQCSALQYSAELCSAWQYCAVQCGTEWCRTV